MIFIYPFKIANNTKCMLCSNAKKNSFFICINKLPHGMNSDTVKSVKFFHLAAEKKIIILFRLSKFVEN